MRIRFSVHIATGMVYKTKGIRATRHDDGQAIMQESPILRFTVDYPLTRERQVEVIHDDGSAWTQDQFVAAVRKAYAEIYAAEPDPGRIAGMLNRATSEGPYGIWGHVLSDLVLEGAESKADGSWELIVGS